MDGANCLGVTADQRDFVRPADLLAVPNVADGCDIGAYESTKFDFIEPSVYLPLVMRPAD